MLDEWTKMLEKLDEKDKKKALEGWEEVGETFWRYMSFFEEGETDELTVAVLKGHLALEELLVLFLKVNTVNESLIDKARLSFHQKRLLVQAHVQAEPNFDASWESIEILNTLRNDVGHNLLATQRSTNSINRLRELVRENFQPIFESMPNPEDDANLVKTTVSMLLGFLIARVHEHRAKLDTERTDAPTMQ